MFAKYLKKWSGSDEPKNQMTDTEAENPHATHIETRSILYRYSFMLTNRKIFGQLDEITTNPFDNFALAKKEVEELGHNSILDQVILTNYEISLEKNLELRADEFSEHFAKYFQNCHLSPYTPKDIQERNEKLYEAYLQILVTIQRIQGWLEDEKLRVLVEEDLTKGHVSFSTMYQCITAFCMVSLGCDQWGRYNIVYSLDYQINHKISPAFASTLVRRIYEFTSGALEPFVTFNCMFADCLAALETYDGKVSTDDCHISKTPLHDLA